MGTMPQLMHNLTPMKRSLFIITTVLSCAAFGEGSKRSSGETKLAKPAQTLPTDHMSSIGQMMRTEASLAETKCAEKIVAEFKQPYGGMINVEIPPNFGPNKSDEIKVVQVKAAPMWDNPYTRELYVKRVLSYCRSNLYRFEQYLSCVQTVTAGIEPTLPDTPASFCNHKHDVDAQSYSQYQSCLVEVYSKTRAMGGNIRTLCEGYDSPENRQEFIAAATVDTKDFVAEVNALNAIMKRANPNALQFEVETMPKNFATPTQAAPIEKRD
jgi:hypothetical protein